jgi:hypothetical protein
MCGIPVWYAYVVSGVIRAFGHLRDQRVLSPQSQAGPRKPARQDS